MFLCKCVHVCMCLLSLHGPSFGNAIQIGRFSSRYETAARKVSAAVIRIPLSREEEQPALLHRERCTHPPQVAHASSQRRLF